MAAVSANMRAKTPLDDIAALLNQILNDLLAEKSDLDTYYTTTKSSLETTIGQLTTLKNQYQATVNQLKSIIQQDTTSRGTKQSTLDGVLPLITSTKQHIANLDSARAEYLARVDSDLDDLAKAIQACRDAIAKMKTYKNAMSTSLLQVASGAKRELQNFSAKMDSMKTRLAKHGSMYAPLINELISLTQNPETEKASKIVDLLNQLLNLLLQAQNDLSQQRAQYENTYNTDRTQAVRDLENYEKQKKQLEDDISALNKRISEKQRELQENQAWLDTYEAQLRDRQQELASLENHYATEGPK